MFAVVSPSSALLLTVLATGALANFLEECDFLSFSRGANSKDPFLHYSCPINAPPYVWCSKLMLSDCIVNDKGVLRGRERGNFGPTCDKCQYNEKTGKLSCWCGDGEGRIHWNSVNLRFRLAFRLKDWMLRDEVWEYL
ncbi:hypothetical protein CkaCkLH20_02515 [Colletotrichum karsti]|uniref:Cyanovirin-N domain-containing protein n=1 Tax=Colletotrichum karsti TaxID=1095194 RepID=A0A9P6LKS6_9PEZI|nr:uncharacterized protein CkaCkLH20_02515 [Colletotrichum karsti]KAF9879704.1 hypothetical protein CkaCkLH20_02515 [Colletotrichum karsti]